MITPTPAVKQKLALLCLAASSVGCSLLLDPTRLPGSDGSPTDGVVSRQDHRHVDDGKPVSEDGTPDTCVGDICGCTPDDAAACAERKCGSVTNNCGQIINCGTCTSPETCVAGGVCGTPPKYYDITFWWRAEGANLDPILDYSAGDTSAVLNKAEISYADKRHGSFSLYCNSPSNYARFDTNLSSIWDGGEIAMGAWVKVLTWVGGQKVLSFEDRPLANEPNYLRLQLVGESGAGNLRLSHKYMDVVSNVATTDGEKMTTNAWYFVYGFFDPATNKHGVKVYDANLTLLDSATSALSLNAIDMTGTPFFFIGSVGGEWPTIYLDNVIISNDATRELNLLADIADYPGN